jgi:hypothetical protein
VIEQEYRVGGHASSTDEHAIEEILPVRIGSMLDRLLTELGFAAQNHGVAGLSI